MKFTPLPATCQDSLYLHTDSGAVIIVTDTSDKPPVHILPESDNPESRESSHYWFVLHDKIGVAFGNKVRLVVFMFLHLHIFMAVFGQIN